jgi:hypothetical protein
MLQAPYLIAAGKMHLGGQVIFKLQQLAFSLKKVVYLPVFMSTFLWRAKKSSKRKPALQLWPQKDGASLDPLVPMAGSKTRFTLWAAFFMDFNSISQHSEGKCHFAAQTICSRLP